MFCRMRWLACVPRAGLASVIAIAALVPRSARAGAVDGNLASLGKLWGVAVIVWGACALIVAVVALLRRAPAEDAGELGRLQTRIRRYRSAAATRAAGSQPRPAPKPEAREAIGPVSVSPGSSVPSTS